MTEARREAVRRFRRDNPSATRDWNRNNPLKVLFKSLGTNARARGRECLLTFAELEELVRPMVCSVTGLPLEWGHPDWSPSIDRLDNDKSYQLGNVRLVCWAYNRARNKSTDEAMLTMARAIVARYGEGR